MLGFSLHKVALRGKEFRDEDTVGIVKHVAKWAWYRWLNFLSMDASPPLFLGALARLVAAVVDVVVAFMLVVSVKLHTHCRMGMLSHKGG